MGVTIFYEGSLLGEEAYQQLVATAIRFAEQRGWPVKGINEQQATLTRMKGDDPWKYVGPVKGVILLPHENSEPFELEFDDQLYMQSYVKTQFAPIETHIAIVDLLKGLQPLFRDLRVEDESEFFESGDVDRLTRHREMIFKVIDDLLAKYPNGASPIRLRNGRIIDFGDKERLDQ